MFGHIKHRRWDLINFLIDVRNYKRYLEIGVQNLDLCFNKVKCPVKHGVDPKGPDSIFKFTSDEFFKQCKSHYDIIFIDGLHQCYQVLRDVANSLAHLMPGGTIILHDCSPLNDKIGSPVPQKGGWAGTVWKAFTLLRASRPDLFMCTLEMDAGCGIVKPGKQQCIKLPETEELTFKYFTNHRREILNFMTFEQFHSLEPELYGKLELSCAEEVQKYGKCKHGDLRS